MDGTDGSIGPWQSQSPLERLISRLDNKSEANGRQFLDFDTADKGTSSKNTKSCRRKKERKIDKRRTQPRNHKSFTIFLTNFKALEKDMSRKDLFFDAVQNAERPVI